MLVGSLVACLREQCVLCVLVVTRWVFVCWRVERCDCLVCCAYVCMLVGDVVV